ncbi:MAG: hypothetical protein RMM08_12220 [Armatimonadota bacterium]|nr:hypothetical protein [bacterium]MDW8322115.1 hypothetical protein [Armatimonadota bacterium]
MKRCIVLQLIGWLVLTAACSAEPLYEFGFNIRSRIRVDNNRNANLLLYSQFGEYSDVHLALHGENRLSVYVSQKLQNFDKPVDPDEIEQLFLSYEGRGWRVRAGKTWMPFGQGMGERELAKGILLSMPLWQGNILDIAFASNGRSRQQGVFCRFGSRSLGASVAVGENLALSKTAFRFIRGEQYEPVLGKGHRLLIGVDTRQVAGVTVWQVEAIVARHGQMPDTEYLIAQASIRLPAGLNPVVRVEANSRARDIRWMASVQQNMGGGFALYPQVVFRRSDFEQANIELRASF